MLSFTVDDENWDDDLGWYDQEEVPMLDMKSVLNLTEFSYSIQENLEGKVQKCSPYCSSPTCGQLHRPSGLQMMMTTLRT